MRDSETLLPDVVRAVVESSSRLAALKALDMQGGEPDTDFDRLSRTAAHIFKAEIALVTLVGQDRQTFNACFGVDGLTGTDTSGSFCAHTIALPNDVAMVVNDASMDRRFSGNSLVTNAPHIRFYAGVPIIVAGEKLGTICVLSAMPRHDIDPDLLVQLADLAGVASSLFTLKDEARVRARTAAALSREEWRHALTLEAGKVGAWVWDVRGGEVVCNDTFRRMYNLPEQGPLLMGQVLEATHPADRAVVEAGLADSLDNGLDYRAEARVAASGCWLTMRGRVYQRDTDGKPLIMMGASIDVTESKRSADQTRLLLRELNHRVKNTLAMIQSVARQTLRQNPEPAEFMTAFSGRLRTISDAHVLLADRDWSGVPLYDVIASQLGPDFLAKPNRADIRGEDVALPADHALGLGLILHELTTNAHRFGAWSSATGMVSLIWDIKSAPERGLALSWREMGGPAVAKPREYGLGVRLIERSLAKVLNSTVQLNFEPDGVAADIWLPLPEPV